MAVEYHTQNGLNAYKTYIALKQHFTTDYDYFKYNGSTNASMDSYKKRKDAIFFEMLGKHPDVVNYIAFSFATFNKVFPKDLATSLKYKANYESMKRKADSIGYTVEQELLGPQISYDEMFIAPTGRHSKIVELAIIEKVSLVTLCALNNVCGLAGLYDITYYWDPVIWPRISNKIKKLSPFVPANREKISSVIRRLHEIE